MVRCPKWQRVLRLCVAMLTAIPHSALAQGTCAPDTTLVRTAWRSVPFALNVPSQSRTSQADSIVSDLVRAFQEPARVQQVLEWQTTDRVELPDTVTAREVPHGRFVLQPAATGGAPAILWERPVLASGIMTALEAAAAHLPQAHWPALPVAVDVGLPEPDAPAVHVLGVLSVQFLFVTAQAFPVSGSGSPPKAKPPYQVDYEVIVDPTGRVMPGSWRLLAGEAAAVSGVRQYAEQLHFSPARIGRCAVAQALRGRARADR